MEKRKRSEGKRWKALWAGWRPVAPIVVTLVLLVLGGGAIAAWWTAHAIPEGSMKCTYGYADAKTARDTARVDAWELASPGKTRPINCGVLRVSDSLRHVDSTTSQRE